MTGDAETDYADGMYRILVNQPNTDIWALSGLDLDDVSVEATALKVGGERYTRFGLVCRADDQGNFYTFIISSDGFLGHRQGARCGLPAGRDGLAPAVGAYPAGLGRKHPARGLLGSISLPFYVNGQVAEVQDGELVAMWALSPDRTAARGWTSALTISRCAGDK